MCRPAGVDSEAGRVEGWVAVKVVGAVAAEMVAADSEAEWAVGSVVGWEAKKAVGSVVG